MNNPLICIIGATASGKTDLALNLADHYPVHLISVDSAQVYRGMDIGSAKLSRAQQQQYPHALIDILDPEQAYSAAQFVHDATQEIQHAWQVGKIPVLVGGTMLYFQALFQGLADLPSANAEVRAQLQQRLQQEGAQALWQELATHDPITAQRISPNDSQRLLRFLELLHCTGQTPSALYAQQRQNRPAWSVLALSLQRERAQLHQRIAQRFHDMMDEGLLEEVARLKARPLLHADAPSMKSAGYRQLWAYLEGQGTLHEAIEQSIIATRQLAKRQITWQNNKLKSALPLETFDASAQSALLTRVERFVHA